MAGEAHSRDTRRGEIQLGDLIRALAQLRPQGPDHVAHVAHSLGFALEGMLAPDVPSEAPKNIHGQLPLRPAAQPSPASKPALPMPPAPQPPPMLPVRKVPSRLVKLDVRAPAFDAPPGWLRENFRLLQPQAGISPSRKSILPDPVARGVFSAALATLRAGHSIDLMALLRDMSRCTLHDLRCQPESTLSRGCQVLLDFADSMLPWWEDLQALPGQVANVVGRQSVSAFDFDGDPGKSACWQPDGERKAWQPAAGCPVLVATDLGMAGLARTRAPKAHWKLFAARCKLAGAPLLILTPWPLRSRPRALGGHTVLMHWNARTSSARIRSAIGRGHKVAP